MLQFNSWRKRQQERFATCSSMHYHRVDDSCYLVVVHLLRYLLTSRIVSQSKAVLVDLNDELADTLLDFLDQMEYAYMHPRSTSAKYRFVQLTGHAISSAIPSTL